MTTVREVMTYPVVTVRRTTPLKEVARLLVEHRISGLPVVDIDGTVLGVVSEADFLVKEGGEEGVSHRPLARLLGDSKSAKTKLDKVHATRAADAMTAPAITIAPGRPLAEAARVMVEHKINRLPVVDEGALVGILTRADLLRAYVRSDEELAETIRQDIILRTLWLDPSGFAVSVKDGVAVITGHVERSSTAEMLAQTTSVVPGIVDVLTHITFEINDSHLRPQPADFTSSFGPR